MRIFKTTALCVGLIAHQAGAQPAERGAGATQSWAVLHQGGYSAFHAGHYAEALADFEQCLPMALTPERRAITLGDIAYSLWEVGRVLEALPRFEQALAAWQSIDPAGHRAGEMAIAVANAQRAAEHFTEAERTLRAALDAPSRDNADTAAVLNALGHLLNEQGRFVESRDKFTTALLLSPSAGENRMGALVGLGDVERATCHWPSAIAHLQESLALSTQTRHARYEALSLRNLGNTYADMGDFARAESLLGRSLAIIETTPALRILYSGTLVSMGVVYGAENKQGLAEDTFMRALDITGAVAADARSVLPLELLATLRAKQRRFAEAEDFANRAYRITSAAFGAESPPAAGALGAVAFVEEQSGDLDRAKRHYSEALRIMRQTDVLNSDCGLGTMSAYAKVLQRLHQRRDAQAVRAQVKAFRSAAQSN